MAHYLVSKDVIKSLAFPTPPTPTSGICRRQKRPNLKTLSSRRTSANCPAFADTQLWLRVPISLAKVQMLKIN